MPYSNFQGAIDDFLSRETTAGFMLFGAAILALIASNTGLAPAYASFMHLPIEFRFGELELVKPLVLWINDGLMAIFFFLIGLEVKREILEGELSSFDKAALPMIAAVGGMALPAGIYVIVNWNSPGNLEGWAIPAATDIAFALGILALLGSRAPIALKVLLLAVAIIDDIGAIIIIALFYTADLSFGALGLALVATAFLVAMNQAGTTRKWPYVLVGVILWVCVLKSGVHATLAGVVTALAVPLNAKDDTSPLKQLEHSLHGWVAFIVLPVFAFANAGVSFAGLELSDLFAPLPLGIALGLIVGKQLGVFGFMVGAVKLGLTKKPAGVSWTQLYGLACLTGVGFTMSLFVGGLAFDASEQMESVKIGVLIGSSASGLMGFLLLRAAYVRMPKARVAIYRNDSLDDD